MKKLIAILICLVMAFSAVALVACGDTTKPTELLLWGASGDQSFLRKHATNWATEYNKTSDKQYVVKVGIMGEGDAGSTLISAPSDGADVFSFADDQLSSLVSAGILATLGDPSTAGTVAKRIAEANAAGSVSAATGADGKLYAYPSTADNGYFLYYRNDLLSKTDVADFDSLMSKAQALGKRVLFNVDDSWYASGMFMGYGGVTSTTATTYNEYADEVAYQVAKLTGSYGNTLVNAAVNDNIGGYVEKDANTIAIISGGWIYSLITEEGSSGTVANTSCTILPQMVNKDNTKTQMFTFLGSKLMGVNSQGKHVAVSHALADYMTSEAVQADRLAVRKAGPSNKVVAASDAMKAVPTIQALAAMAEHSRPQVNLPNGYWDAVKNLIIAVKENKDNAYYTTTSGGVVSIVDAAVATLASQMVIDMKLIAA